MMDSLGREYFGGGGGDDGWICDLEILNILTSDDDEEEAVGAVQPCRYGGGWAMHLRARARAEASSRLPPAGHLQLFGAAARTCRPGSSPRVHLLLTASIAPRLDWLWLKGVARWVKVRRSGTGHWGFKDFTRRSLIWIPQLPTALHVVVSNSISRDGESLTGGDPEDGDELANAACSSRTEGTDRKS